MPSISSAQWCVRRHPVVLIRDGTCTDTQRLCCATVWVRPLVFDGVCAAKTERILIERMTSDRKLKAFRERLKWRSYGTCLYVCGYPGVLIRVVCVQKSSTFAPRRYFCGYQVLLMRGVLLADIQHSCCATVSGQVPSGADTRRRVCGYSAFLLWHGVCADNQCC